jgi:hypothetical protein
VVLAFEELYSKLMGRIIASQAAVAPIPSPMLMPLPQFNVRGSKRETMKSILAEVIFIPTYVLDMRAHIAKVYAPSTAASSSSEEKNSLSYSSDSPSVSDKELEQPLSPSDSEDDRSPSSSTPSSPSLSSSPSPSVPSKVADVKPADSLASEIKSALSASQEFNVSTPRSGSKATVTVASQSESPKKENSAQSRSLTLSSPPVRKSPAKPQSAHHKSLSNSHEGVLSSQLSGRNLLPEKSQAKRKVKAEIFV